MDFAHTAFNIWELNVDPIKSDVSAFQACPKHDTYLSKHYGQVLLTEYLNNFA